MTHFIRHNATDDTALHGTVLAAPPEPRAVVAIVHGFGEHAGRYAPVADMLSARGYAVLGLDLHGHGRTPGKRGEVRDYERLREDVDALIDEAAARFPGKPLFVWGHSMGGGLALDWALERGAAKLSGMIATAPAIRAVEAPPRPMLAVFRLIGRVWPGFALDNAIDGTKISSLPEEQSRYVDDPLTHGRLGVGLGLGILSREARLLAEAGRFPLPLLLLHSRDDQLTEFAASEAFAQSCPRCNFHAFEGVEHEIHNDSSRARVVELMDAFMTEQLSQESAT